MTISRISSGLIPVPILLLQLSGCLVGPVIPDSHESRILVGAIRWDAWHTPLEDSAYGGYGGPVKAVELALSQQRYLTRAPFFSTILSDSTVKIGGYTREVMDREIGYARSGGLDYWAFLLYPPGSVMSQGLDLYLSSDRKSEIGFCAIANPAHWQGDPYGPDCMGRFIQLMKEPSYVRVGDSRPLFYMFRPDGRLLERFGGKAKAREWADSLRNRATREGPGNPYMVVMHHHTDTAIQMARILGAEAVSSYARPGDGGMNGTPYAELTRVARQFWEECAGKGQELIPLSMSGWNRLPRIERPVPWEQDWQKPGEGMEKYYALPTPLELAEHILETCRWAAGHPELCPAGAIIVYAWNEHDEGGWLCPTINGDGSIDDSRLRELARLRKPRTSYPH